MKESERSAENTNLWETLIVSKLKNAVQKNHPRPLHRNDITSRGLLLFQNKHRIGTKVLKIMF